MTDDAPPPLPVMPLDYADPPPAAVRLLVGRVGWVNVVVGGIGLAGGVAALGFGAYGSRFLGYFGPLGVLGGFVVSAAQLASGVACAGRSRAAGRLTVVWLWVVAAISLLEIGLPIVVDRRPIFAMLPYLLLSAGRYALSIGLATVSYLAVCRPSI